MSTIRKNTRKLFPYPRPTHISSPKMSPTHPRFSPDNPYRRPEFIPTRREHTGNQSNPQDSLTNADVFEIVFIRFYISIYVLRIFQKHPNFQSKTQVRPIWGARLFQAPRNEDQHYDYNRNRQSTRQPRDSFARSPF